MGVGAVRAWRRLPRESRKALLSGKRAPETTEEAEVALGFARFALSGVGLLSVLVVLLGFFVVAMFGLAALGDGLGVSDYAIVGASVGVGGVRHLGVYRRLRASASKALHPIDP